MLLYKNYLFVSCKYVVWAMKKSFFYLSLGLRKLHALKVFSASHHSRGGGGSLLTVRALVNTLFYSWLIFSFYTEYIWPKTSVSSFRRC